MQEYLILIPIGLMVYVAYMLGSIKGYSDGSDKAVEILTRK